MLTRLALIGYAVAPFVGLAALWILHRPLPPPAPAPVVVWFAVCPGGGFWGPYPTADTCRTKLEDVKIACRTPLSAPNVPNPAFVAIEEICRDDFAGTHCACEYDVAVPGRPVLPGRYTPGV